MKRLLLALAVTSAAIYVGCKQQDGERCQINEDCESGECNTAKGTCTSNLNTQDIDADVPDGTIDAPDPADAPSDTPRD